MHYAHEILPVVTEIHSEIVLAKINEKMNAMYKGNILFNKCILKDVLYVPELSKNLISVHKITNNGGTVRFSANEVKTFFKINVKARLKMKMDFLSLDFLFYN